MQVRLGSRRRGWGVKERGRVLTPHHQVGEHICDNDAHVPAMGARGRLLSRHRGGRFSADGGRDATALHLCSCVLGACEVPPADGGLERAHLGQREPMCRTLGMCSAHDAELRIALPPQAVKRPHPLTLACRSAQELMRLPLDRLAEVEHREQRWRCWRVTFRATTRSFRAKNMAAHRLLLSASDHAFHGCSLTRAVGIRMAPGALFFVVEPT